MAEDFSANLHVGAAVGHSDDTSGTLGGLFRDRKSDPATKHYGCLAKDFRSLEALEAATIQKDPEDGTTKRTDNDQDNPAIPVLEEHEQLVDDYNMIWNDPAFQRNNLKEAMNFPGMVDIGCRSMRYMNPGKELRWWQMVAARA
ncbi:hypothetical protein BU24DRAFT_482048 [Aaosphaeria arxii CBS 175.79]|uniref:Uncharacterized protein n=1 Tax=Aaosphaeria arxii CBS 175.79 TaxID=1450172 RepID=A0A6A5XQG7_9PLEO|nr:uncharacterized protein BU24DRAFT_482048 [Aaosphaeria arxii CBS 175.79]KAF2014544.1 hypothetical protein BU24DRAFT_482048 [Aaosphaeria arxii CBS 175.79]